MSMMSFTYRCRQHDLKTLNRIVCSIKEDNNNILIIKTYRTDTSVLVLYMLYASDSGAIHFIGTRL